VRRERAVWFFVVFTPQKVQLPPFLRLSRFHPFITCVRYICIPALGYSCSHFPLFHPFTKIPASSCVHNDVRPSFTPPTEPSRSCLQGPLRRPLSPLLLFAALRIAFPSCPFLQFHQDKAIRFYFLVVIFCPLPTFSLSVSLWALPTSLHFHFTSTSFLLFSFPGGTSCLLHPTTQV
jgi:hypothetical protein